MPHRLAVLLFLCLIALCPAPTSAQEPADMAITLHPGMDELPAPDVPRLYATVPDADRVSARLEILPAQPYRWVVGPDEAFAATVAAPADDGEAVLTVWDWHCRPVAQHRFPRPCRQALRFTVTGRGTYLLTLDAMRGRDCRARLARSFAACPSNLDRRELWRQSGFLPGTCSFPGRQHWTNDFGPAHPPGLDEQATRELDAELAARQGLVLVRPDIAAGWEAADQPMDFTRADAALKAFTDHGFRLAYQVALPPADWTLAPQYAAVTDPKWRYPRQEAFVRAFTKAQVERYGERVEFFEIYNEPDNADFWRGTTEEFIATHRWIAETIRTTLPGKPILSGGLCLMDPERTGLMAAGLREWVDAVGYHSHGPVEGLQAALVAMRAVHAAAGYRRPAFYNTEMGFANWRLDMERHAAATSVQKLLYCWAHGNPAGLLYCSRDIGGPRMSAGDWGAVDYFMCPRFTYGAVAAWVEQFAGAIFESVLAERNGLYAYLFRRGDDRLAAIFVGSDYPRPVKLRTDAVRATLCDPMGNLTPVESREGQIACPAGFYPTILVLEAATRASLAE